MTSSQVSAVNATLSSMFKHDGSDSYDTRYEVMAWTGTEWTRFVATVNKDRYERVFGMVRTQLPAGTRLIGRLVPGWDDGDEITVLQDVVL